MVYYYIFINFILVERIPSKYIMPYNELHILFKSTSYQYIMHFKVL